MAALIGEGSVFFSPFFSSLFNNQPDASVIQIYSVIKLKCFGHLLCPSSGGFYCTFSIGKFDAILMTASKQSQDRNAILTLLGSGHQTCMKLTNDECTVENS